MTTLLEPRQTAVADLLDAAQIRTRISSRVVGRELHVLDEVSSTNRVLVDKARAGAVEGTVVVADAQRDGRGREGKRWFSPPGVNLHMSILFRPSIHVEEAPVFALIGSIALVDAVRAAGVDSAFVKWPNDIVSNNRKIGGTLVELGLTGTRFNFLVIGAGLNVNIDRDGLDRGLGEEARRATSLQELAGKSFDRNDLAVKYVDFLDLWLHLWMERGAKAVLDAWNDRDAFNRQMIEVRTVGGAPLRGWVVGLDNLGRLVVEDQAGGWHPVISGEIRVPS